MKNLICAVFGHKRVVTDWYPNSPVTRICCMRCDEVLEEKDNPTYNPNWVPPTPPWEENVKRCECCGQIQPEIQPMPPWEE